MVIGPFFGTLGLFTIPLPLSPFPFPDLAGKKAWRIYLSTRFILVKLPVQSNFVKTSNFWTKLTIIRGNFVDFNYKRNVKNRTLFIITLQVNIIFLLINQLPWGTWLWSWQVTSHSIGYCLTHLLSKISLISGSHGSWINEVAWHVIK